MLIKTIHHSALPGLGNDDHAQYHTDARAATWLAANHETTYNHGDIASNTTHRSSDGSDHSYIDQGVTIASTPTFAGLIIPNDGWIGSIGTNQAIQIEASGDINMSHDLAVTGSFVAGTDVFTVNAVSELVTINGTHISGIGTFLVTTPTHAYMTMDCAENRNSGLFFKENGTPKWLIDHNGAVDGVLRFYDYSGTPGDRVTITPSTGLVTVINDFAVNGDVNMSQDLAVSGDVGIGIGTFEHKLHVVGNSDDYVTATVVNIDDLTTSGGRKVMQLTSEANAAGFGFLTKGNNKSWDWFLGGGGEMRFDSNDGTSKLFITNTAKQYSIFANNVGVGIGKNSASVALDVNGNINLGAGDANDVVTQWVTDGGTGTFHYDNAEQQWEFDKTVRVVSLGLPNSAEILDSGNGWTNLSGDGTIDAGLGIAVPQVAGDDFFYGFGGTECHHFSGKMFIDSDIDSEGSVFNLGNQVLADVRITFRTASLGDVNISFNDADEEFQFSEPVLVTGHITAQGAITSTIGDLTIQEGNIFHNAITQTFSGSKTLTDGVATGFVDIAIDAGEFVGGSILYSIKVTDGTPDYQNHSGAAGFVAINKAGVVDSDCSETYSPAAVLKVTSAGTLTDAVTCVDTNGTPGKITLQMNANTSLAGATIIFDYTITMHSENVITSL